MEADVREWRLDVVQFIFSQSNTTTEAQAKSLQCHSCLRWPWIPSWVLCCCWFENKASPSAHSTQWTKPATTQWRTLEVFSKNTTTTTPNTSSPVQLIKLLIIILLRNGAYNKCCADSDPMASFVKEKKRVTALLPWHSYNQLKKPHSSCFWWRLGDLSTMNQTTKQVPMR
jgi:hypothetical protein